MNTDITIHPRLQHCGLTTANLDAMIEWYRKVLGMTVHKRVAAPAGSPFRAVAFATNDEVNHRLSFFETPDVSFDNDKAHHARVQHIAFAYDTLDDLLGTYVRLKKQGMLPLWAADQFFQTAIYYEDPDGNIIEPAQVVEVVSQSGSWLAQSDLPKLFINGEPGALARGRLREIIRRWPSQTEVTVKGRKLLQEDSPDEIGAAIADFVKRVKGIGETSRSPQ